MCSRGVYIYKKKRGGSSSACSSLCTSSSSSKRRRMEKRGLWGQVVTSRAASVAPVHRWTTHLSLLLLPKSVSYIVVLSTYSWGIYLFLFQFIPIYCYQGGWWCFVVRHAGELWPNRAAVQREIVHSRFLYRERRDTSRPTFFLLEIERTFTVWKKRFVCVLNWGTATSSVLHVIIPRGRPYSRMYI